MLTIYVGDVSKDLANFALQQDGTAYMIDKHNCDNLHKGTVYLSLGDIESVSKFFSILSTADKIVFVPPRSEKWSDGKTILDRYSMAWITAHGIRMIAGMFHIEIQGLIPSTYELAPKPKGRVSQLPQLWIAGCSTTYGVGIKSTQTYGHLLSTTLAMPYTMLAYPATSIKWAADQILRSDIMPADIVVWGITELCRFPWIWNNKECHISPSFYKQHPEFIQLLPLDFLTCDTRLYEALIAIESVENFCNKTGAKLILISIHADLDLLGCISDRENLLVIHGMKGLDHDSSFLDLGDDNLHPGQLTHQMYADKVIEKLRS